MKLFAPPKKIWAPRVAEEGSIRGGLERRGSIEPADALESSIPSWRAVYCESEILLIHPNAVVWQHKCRSGAGAHDLRLADSVWAADSGEM